MHCQRTVEGTRYAPLVDINQAVDERAVYRIKPKRVVTAKPDRQLEADIEWSLSTLREKLV